MDPPRPHLSNSEAATVAVACPFCMTMIGDGTRELGVDDDLDVKDIAELLADRVTNTGAPS